MAIVVGALITVFGAVVLHFIAHDLYAGAPAIASFLLKLGTKALPPVERARYEEEWAAALDEHSGALLKLWYAVRCALGAPALGRFLREKPVVMCIGGEVIRMGYLATSMFFVYAIARKRGLPLKDEEIASVIRPIMSDDDHPAVQYIRQFAVDDAVRETPKVAAADFNRGARAIVRALDIMIAAGGGDGRVRFIFPVRNAQGGSIELPRGEPLSAE